MSVNSLAPDRRTISLSFVLILIVWLSLFIVRLTAPSDLLDNDQETPAAYMMDAAVNGHWIIQVDDAGAVCSKPPVYTWMGGLLILAFGEINHFTLLFPSALAVLGCCVLTWCYGRRYFGHAAALLASLMFVVSPSGAKMIYLARTDSVFAFMASLCAFTGFSAWVRGKGWTWFWLAGAAATLTKGPLGILLAACGLLAHLWEKRSDPEIRFRGRHWLGTALFLVITLGWLALAYHQLGHAMVKKMLGDELLGHANWSGSKKHFGVNLFVPFLYFVSRFLPWSLFTLAECRSVLRNPASDPVERRFERFLVCYLVAGILIFSLFPHQRADHLFPLLTAAALLAGRQFARRFGMVLSIPFLSRILMVWCAVLLLLAGYYNVVRGKDPVVLKTAGVREVAKQVEKRFGKGAPILYVDGPYALQFYLGTMHRMVSMEEAAKRLEGSQRVLVAVREVDRLRKLLPSDAAVHEVIRWPLEGPPYVTILSNRELAAPK